MTGTGLSYDGRAKIEIYGWLRLMIDCLNLSKEVDWLNVAQMGACVERKHKENEPSWFFYININERVVAWESLGKCTGTRVLK